MAGYVNYTHDQLKLDTGDNDDSSQYTVRPIALTTTGCLVLTLGLSLCLLENAIQQAVGTGPL